MVADAGLKTDFEIDSAGTIGYHAGNPPDSRMLAQLKDRNYCAEGKARKLKKSDLEKFDLLLVMDDENLAGTLALDPNGANHTKVRRFVDYLRKMESACIPDPYYGGEKGFSYVIDLLEDGCVGLLDELRGAH